MAVAVTSTSWRLRTSAVEVATSVTTGWTLRRRKFMLLVGTIIVGIIVGIIDVMIEISELI